ncbi:MAG: hypothetical protein GXY37_04055 [Chloroflexi bacterium]|nr:hypothetical protein [Chloroflexota bacterium]
MNLITLLFGEPAIRTLDSMRKAEVKSLIEKLVRIGQTDDFLSLAPGGPFNMQMHHREAREIGQRVNEIGGLPLMEAVRNTIKRRLKAVMAEHLDHAWKGIGDWKP